MRAALRAVLLRGASTGLDLNFAGGVFSLNTTRSGAVAAIPGWSFSRTDTNGTATALDLAGNVIQFATGTPRITNRGILVEEARTNLLLNSTTFGTTWAQTNVTIGSDVIAAPDGSTTADSLIENAAAAIAHRVTQAVTTTATATTVSCHLKAGSRSWAYIRMSNSVPANCFAWINLATGALGTVSGTGATASVQTLANGWYRLSLTVATAVAGANTIVVAGSTGDNVQDYDGTNGLTAIYVWGAQCEAGAFATSPIITTGAAGTRGADAGLPTFANALGTPLTIVADFTGTTVSGGLGAIGIASLDDGSTANRVQVRAIYTGGNAQQTVVTASSVLENADSGIPRALSGSRQALRITSDGRVTTAANGAIAVAETAALSIPTTNRLSLGSIPGSISLNGYIRRVQVLPYAATDAQLQALTAP